MVALRPSAALADLTSPEVGQRAHDGAVLVIPVGATEQHGAHLPLRTDTAIAEELCRRLARRRREVLIAPAISYGASGEHAGFPGTISIGQEALGLLLLEYGRSACDTFRRIVFVNAHGGNAVTARRVVERLRYEGRDVRLHLVGWRGDAHAGHSETSLQLVSHPELVRMEQAVVGDTRDLAEILPLLRLGGIRAVTATGVLGDPRSASAEAGRRLWETLETALLSAYDQWAPVVTGRPVRP